MSYNRCYNLQFAVSCTSLASTAIVASVVLALLWPDAKTTPIMMVVACLALIVPLAVNCIINQRLYRWFNTERAIAKTLQEGGNFQENLLPDSQGRFGSSLSFTGGMCCMMTLLMRYGQPWMILAALAISVILHVATLIFAAALAVRAARWRAERSEWEDRKIAVYTYCSWESDGTRTESRRMKGINEVKEFYRYV